MKRFILTLTDEVYDEFLRYFSGHGSRTVILRRCVLRLTELAKTTGKIWDQEVDNITENLMSRQNKKVTEIEKEIQVDKERGKWEY